MALFELEDVGDNYLALNLHFPPQLVEKMRLELELTRQQQVIDKLIKHYSQE